MKDEKTKAQDITESTKAQESVLSNEEKQALIGDIISEAKKEAAKIIAQAQEQVTPPPEKAYDPLDELVEVTLFKDGKDYKDDVFVSVNDERCQIKRGVPVKIKKKFALVLEQSKEQDLATARLIEEESNKYREEAKKYQI